MKPTEINGYMEKLTDKARERHDEETAADTERQQLILSEINRIGELRKSGASSIEIARAISETLIEKLGVSGNLIWPSFEVVIESGKHDEFGEYDIVARLTSFDDTDQDSSQTADDYKTSYFLGVGIVPHYIFDKKMGQFFKDDTDQLELKKAAQGYRDFLPNNTGALISIQKLSRKYTGVTKEFSDWCNRMLNAERDRIDQKLEVTS